MHIIYASRHSFGKTIANFSLINICFCCHQQFLLLKLTKMHIYLLMSLIVSVYLKVEILQLITDFRCLCNRDYSLAESCVQTTVMYTISAASLIAITSNSLSLFKQKHFKGINPLWGFLYKYCANSTR